jgi:uncharacterized protein DUF3307
MSWSAAFAAFFVSHLVGDFLLQTEWQAVAKSGGLGDRRARGALVTHVLVYTLAFVPALLWIANDTSAGRAVAVGAVIAVPHLLVDDGHLVRAWVRDVKRAPRPSASLMLAVDQSFHFVCLLGAALLAAA